MPAAKPGPDATTAARDARRLSTLLEVSQALSGTLNLKASMQRVLQILIRHHGVVRGMVTLLRDGELHVEAVEGLRGSRALGPLQGRRRHHRPGRRERQADRRAARQPRAGVPQPRAAARRHPAPGAELRLRADHRCSARRSARSPSICASRPSATSTAA